jgi:hypothetical protein
MRQESIWARDMGKSENEALTQYFPDRHLWFLNGDDPVL